MPPTYIVITISIVFVAVVAFLQFFYWTWIASADRREAELVQSLDSIFRAISAFQIGRHGHVDFFKVGQVQHGPDLLKFEKVRHRHSSGGCVCLPV